VKHWREGRQRRPVTLSVRQNLIYGSSSDRPSRLISATFAGDLSTRKQIGSNRSRCNLTTIWQVVHSGRRRWATEPRRTVLVEALRRPAPSGPALIRSAAKRARASDGAATTASSTVAT